MKRIRARKEGVKKMPDTAGVYLFRDKSESVIYVG